tara:strand:- start:3733 stop:4329 length:597 start_codon:yes stop_codon:yes gene_type:complete
MSYRIEEKIPLSKFEALSFIENLKQQGCSKLYPMRRINSDYFDNHHYDLFRDSEEGLLPRKKIRIRNYPDEPSIKYNLETKVSSIEGRYKTSEALTQENLKTYIKEGYFDKEYGILKAKVRVSYDRKYYLYKGIRITLDTEIQYQDLRHSSNKYFEHSSVVEIKAPDETSLDFLLYIVPENRRRFSKYCNAIRFLNLV